MKKMNPIFNIKDNESLIDYKLRLYKNKEVYKLTWSDIAYFINDVTGDNYTESKYRKECSTMDLSQYKEDIEYQKDELRQLEVEIRKEKIKLRDERSAVNRRITRDARQENLMELAYYYADNMNAKKQLNFDFAEKPVPSNKSAILQLSDWHLGIEIHNYWNDFDIDICKDRVSRFIYESIEKCKMLGVTDVYVLNLGDLMCGRIHAQLQIESQTDVINQTLIVCEILAEALNELSKHFNVHFYSCLDNHSRVEPDKKKALELESFARIIPHHLMNRIGVGNNNRIHIHAENEFAPDIITLEINGWNIAAVHGDHDKQKQVIKNISLMTRDSYDLILTAHEHHFQANELNECLTISNPSLMGTDGYAKNLRLTSYPAQNLIIVGDDTPAEYVCRIVL